MHTEGLCLRVTHAMEVTAAKTQWEMLQSTAAKQKPSFQRFQDAGTTGFPVGSAGFEPATPGRLQVKTVECNSFHNTPKRLESSHF